MFRKLTSVERATLGVVAWLALQVTEVDEQLLASLGVYDWAVSTLEFGLMVAWIIGNGRYPTRSLATGLGPLAHFIRDHPPGDRPRRVKKTYSKEIEALQNALREVVSSTRTDNRRRDQLIAALYRAGLSYRQIAPDAAISHVKVGEIVRSTEPVEVTLRPPPGRTYPLTYDGHYVDQAPQADPFADDPTLDWERISPRQVVSYMARHYADLPPVSAGELRQILDELNAMKLPDPQIRPDWQWTVEDFRGLMQHALMGHRETVRPEEVATLFRQSALSQKYRLEGYGIDAMAEVRVRWADAMGRLAVEALRNFPQTPEVPETP